MAAERTSDCVREQGGRSIPRHEMSQGTICLELAHTPVCLLSKQLQPAVTACAGSFMERQGFQTLVFP